VPGGAWTETWAGGAFEGATCVAGVPDGIAFGETGRRSVRTGAPPVVPVPGAPAGAGLPTIDPRIP